MGFDSRTVGIVNVVCGSKYLREIVIDFLKVPEAEKYILEALLWKLFFSSIIFSNPYLSL